MKSLFQNLNHRRSLRNPLEPRKMPPCMLYITDFQFQHNHLPQNIRLRPVIPHGMTDLSDGNSRPV